MLAHLRELSFASTQPHYHLTTNGLEEAHKVRLHEVLLRGVPRVFVVPLPAALNRNAPFKNDELYDTERYGL